MRVKYLEPIVDTMLEVGASPADILLRMIIEMISDISNLEVDTINRYLANEIKTTKKIDKGLHEALGTPTGFWLNLQKEYDNQNKLEEEKDIILV